MKTTVETTTKWTIDKAHSRIEFKARHLMITTVTGEFKNYEAEITSQGDDFESAHIVLTADINSISTGDEKRDAHLKGSDFFNSEKYPELKFVSTSLNKAGENKYILNGDLTIGEITKPVSLNVVHEGTVKDPWGNTKAGFTITGKVNRKDFGLKWNVVTETGGVLVGEEVAIKWQCTTCQGAASVIILNFYAGLYDSPENTDCYFESCLHNRG